MKYWWQVPATIVLLNLAGEPYALGYAAFIALIPLFSLFELKSWKRFLLGWACGFGVQSSAFSWVFITIRDFGGLDNTMSAAGSILFWMYQGLDIGLWLWLAPVLAQKLPQKAAALAPPALWLILQAWVYPHVFPWQYGALLSSVTLFSGAAAFWGSHGLGFLTIYAQSLAALSSQAIKKRLLFFCLPLLLLLSGNLFRVEPADPEIWKIGVVQPNLVKWAKRSNPTIDDIFKVHYNPTIELLKQDLDLVIWPETALAFNLDRYVHYQAKIRDLVDSHDVGLITGVLGREKGAGYYNEIRLYQPGTLEWQTYRKVKLVMFSESVPWIFSWAKRFDPSMGSFISGLDNKPFRFRDRDIIPLVCFEALFPDYVARYNGQLLVNLTNDAWFGETSASRQHLQQIQLRSVERNAPLVRATNSGVSCWVDRQGQIRDAGGLYKAETHIFEVPVAKTSNSKEWGVFLIQAIIASLFVLLLAGRFRTKRPD